MKFGKNLEVGDLIQKGQKEMMDLTDATNQMIPK